MAGTPICSNRRRKGWVCKIGGGVIQIKMLKANDKMSVATLKGKCDTPEIGKYLKNRQGLPPGDFVSPEVLSTLLHL